MVDRPVPAPPPSVTPRPGTATVLREPLVQRLTAVPDDVPLILLVAPAGYGKTTLLDQWAAVDGRGFARVTVDEADDDPVRLMAKVILALHQVEPLDRAVFGALSSRDVSLRSVLVPRLERALLGRRKPFVLVLDDVSELHDAAGLEALLSIAEHVPVGSHVAMTARDRGGLPLGSLRARRRSVDLGPEDLAFTEDEAARLLRGCGLDWPPEAVRELVRRTEGWPAGVYLAALSAKAPDDLSEALGAETYVDYFRDELLSRLNERSVTFLLRTSVLDELSGPLCDAILGESGSRARLAEVVERNLFVVPLDSRGEWYRYHGLFREMLRNELRRREPGAEARLHRLASEWFERHAAPDKAIAHAIKAKDVATAARLVTANAQSFVDAGRVVTVKGWLDAFTDADLAAYPPLAVAAAWVWALSGDGVQAQRALLAAERGSFDGPPPDGSSSLASGTAMARAVLAPYGVERMLLDAGEAFALEPPGSPWRPVAAVLLGCARLLNGLRREAAWPLDLAAELGRDRQPAAAHFALAQRSLLAADDDDWSTAQSCSAAAWELMHEAGLEDYLPSVMVYAAAARVAEHRGDLHESRQLVGRALRLYAVAPMAFAWLGAQVSIVLGRLLLELHDPEGAGLRLEEARRQLGRLLTEGALRSQLEQLTKSVALYGDEAGVSVSMTLSPAELRVLQLLQTHLTLAEIAEELHVSRNTVKSQVSAVYRKLDVSSRSAALRQARSLGLVGW